MKDPPYGRSQATQMRDLLRQLERHQTASRPARPTAPPPGPLLAPLLASRAPVRAIGGWVLAEDDTTGDLIAIDPDGNTHVVITRGAP